MNNRYNKMLGYIFLLPYLTVFFVFLIIPMAYGLILSFFRWEMLSPEPPRFLGFGNYLEAFTNNYFYKALWATFRFVIMAVPVNIASALLVACGINLVPQKRQGFYRAAYFLPTILTISIVGILWTWFYNSEFGLLNSILSVVNIKVPWVTDTDYAMKSIVLMTLWWTMGGSMIILLAGLANIPQEYYEAASIDGAGIWKKFWNITLPSLRPVLLFVVIMNIIASFQVFGQTYIVTGGGPELSTRVMVHYIYDTAFGEYRMGYAAAVSWLLFLVIAVFSFIQFKSMKGK
jgi:multiple sugar transport system permease protein